jgi:ABC-type transport system involved in cytochrome bd biosynthesis fused ATPase/permease subunit
VSHSTREILLLARGARGWIALSTVLSLAVTATYVGQGVAIAWALLRILDHREWSSVVAFVVIAFVLVVVRAALTWVREWVVVTTGSTIKRTLRSRCFTKLFELGPGYSLGVRAGDVQSTVIDGIERLEAYFSKFVSQLVAAVVGASAILIGLIVINPLIGGVLTAVAVAIAATPLLARRLQKERSAGYWDQWRLLGADYLDVLQAMTTLKLFDATETKQQELATRSWRFYRASLMFVAVANLRTGAMGLLSSGGAAVAIALGVPALASGSITSLGLLLVLLLAREAFRPLEELQKAYHSAYPALAAARGILRFLDEPITTVPPTTQRADEAKAAYTGDSIELRDVTFHYSTEPALREVNLSVPQGSTVALVGRSGAGKSTVVSLLLRFVDASSGTVLLGGQDIRELPTDFLRSTVAVVSQDTYLFQGSLRENLLLGKPDATDAELDVAIEAAGAMGIVHRLSAGYDAVVGERGTTLSGGERQRIAIARALLTNAPILVLDEATSSLDSETEEQIGHALSELSRGRTTLVIAHRLSTVRNADRIFVLERGAVVESGTHVQLSCAAGPYARLLAAQEIAV